MRSNSVQRHCLVIAFERASPSHGVEVEVLATKLKFSQIVDDRLVVGSGR